MNGLDLYARYSPIIKTADLIEFSNNSICSFAIRWRTKEIVSHTSGAILYKMVSGTQVRRYIGESVGKGFILSYLSDRLRHWNTKAYLLRLKSEYDEYRVRIAEEALKLEGTPYDFLSIFKQLKGPVKLDTKQLFCSEVWQVALIKVGLLEESFNNGCALVPGQFWMTGLYKEAVRLF